MNANSPKRLTLPTVAIGIGLVGGSMFFLGRSLAPTPPQVASTDHENEDEGAHEESEHSEGDHEESGHDAHEEEAIRFTPEALKSAGVEVATVTVRPQGANLPFDGSIDLSPDRVARVASVVSGRITRLNVVVGAEVRQGQILALVESRSVGEAQSALRQATARLQNARSSYEVVQQQARAGVFSRSPLEAARRAQNEAAAEVQTGEAGLHSAQLNFERVRSLARLGTFSRPSLEASRGRYASALEQVQSAQAALDGAEAAVVSATSELTRRRLVASTGGYASRPVEEARRALVTAQSARATAASEVATTRSNLARARSLSAEGLISTRDLETAQLTFDTAQARLAAAESDERTASQELERQQKLAAFQVAGNAEVAEAQARLATARSEVRTRRAQLQNAREALRLATVALGRERQTFNSGIANRSEVTQVRTTVENAKTVLSKARRNLTVTLTALERETRIFRQNLNNNAQLQSAQAAVVSAQSDMDTAQSALRLLKASPGRSAIVPLTAPLSGIVQARDVVQGESVEADKNLFTIANLDVVHVDMFLPERDIARVRVGADVQVTVDAVPGRTFNGTIELIHTELDPKTRTVEAHAEIANPGMLRAGMFARGSISTGGSVLAMTIPADAVQDLEGKKVVFVQGEKAGEFTAREVALGSSTGGRTAVKSGLKAGELIVVKGAFMVKAQAMKAELGHEH
jgi:RND family efflux transporter MFP subunit